MIGIILLSIIFIFYTHIAFYSTHGYHFKIKKGKLNASLIGGNWLPRFKLFTRTIKFEARLNESCIHKLKENFKPNRIFGYAENLNKSIGVSIDWLPLFNEDNKLTDEVVLYATCIKDGKKWTTTNICTVKVNELFFVEIYNSNNLYHININGDKNSVSIFREHKPTKKSWFKLMLKPKFGNSFTKAPHNMFMYVRLN